MSVVATSHHEPALIAAPARTGRAASASGCVEFRLLGPVTVHDGAGGRDITPPGSKQRALLASFVTQAGVLLDVDRLAAELWDGAPPANAANALQAHVARLRRLLPAAGGGHEWIRTLPTGYTLNLGNARTDVQHFARRSREGRAALAANPARAAELLHSALELWRGPALQGCRTGPICEAEAERLDEIRLTSLEALHEANLRCERHGESIGELERLTADHPLRERFYDLLMVALYRSGRQTEALGVYERARRRLVGALGIEPGPALRARLDAILAHSPGLSAAPAPALLEELGRLRHRVTELGLAQHELTHRVDAVTAPES
ncbi:BTAD domain-containing putative transcriptional regulator [Streptomyces sp. NBC_01089]|uniref:AfsR/SARP family transcriptional regulator n=1 Tax=Streptomyces sp. NBC_01089 TaxID=2903747 RepID=UPI003864EF72|nr:AfsR/SARP family transcriptional regulator [Streptomyces sp. NBC_01089]WSU46284.1 AfsR/SARP family transcriptional regulator [Streptomyces sp. NBC_01089]